MKYLLKLSLLLLLGQIGLAQEQYTEIEGYVYEENNRGYISDVTISILNEDNGGLEATTKTDKDGFLALGLIICIRVLRSRRSTSCSFLKWQLLR